MDPALIVVMHYKDIDKVFEKSEIAVAVMSG